ncbi:MAG: hypothetical protein ABEJ58_10905 [Halodesulfurarchaeum sp.]
MQWIDLLIGSAWSQRIVVLGTIGVYGYLLARKPDVARRSAEGGLRRFAGLFTLIVAALFLASAIGTLVPTGGARAVLGESAQVGGIVFAGLLGGLLPGGPYAVYPIIQGIGAQGASLAAVIAMLIGYGAIGIGRVAYGLVFFDVRTVATRVGIGIVGTALVAVVAFAILP